MSIFEYPYVIIMILVMVLLSMGILGLHFMRKSVKAGKDTLGKYVCTLSQIENEFRKASELREKRCLLYISMSLDGMKRLQSESVARRVYDQIANILFCHFGINVNGDIAPYGEDNFVSVNALDENEIVREIELCVQEINKVFVNHGAVGVARIHFGYYLTSSNEVSFRTALARAKQACSIAVNRKNLYCRWDHSNGKEFERKINIENNIENEIENNHFFLEYQPLVDAKTNKILGAEVLSRLNSPKEGVLAPAMFLDAVNHVGLNQKFDYYIFEKNCKWIANDPEKRMKYVYTTNFSRHSLCDPDLAKNLLKIIDKYGIRYSCIAVEILEDKDVTGNEKANMLRNLKLLKQKGIMILLDDFGSGHTSFNDLNQFDVNIVKIDRSIIRNADNERGFLLLKNIVRTAHELGFQTLCEGVETKENHAIALEAGCDMFQGYYFYRPMPVAQLETLLENQ